MSGRKRVGVLISGRGSNLSALIAAQKAPHWPAPICLVISNRPGAAGLDIAKSAGIKALTIDHTAFAGREEFEADLHAALIANKVDLVVCAGFMRKLTAGFTDKWQGRIINIHPSLLPKYKGLDTHARALEAGDSEAGCTVHHVTSQLDSGPIIAQARVPIKAGDTPETLAARVLKAEHEIFPKALASVARQL